MTWWRATRSVRVGLAAGSALSGAKEKSVAARRPRRRRCAHDLRRGSSVHSRRSRGRRAQSLRHGQRSSDPRASVGDPRPRARRALDACTPPRCGSGAYLDDRRASRRAATATSSIATRPAERRADVDAQASLHSLRSLQILAQLGCCGSARASPPHRQSRASASSSLRPTRRRPHEDTKRGRSACSLDDRAGPPPAQRWPASSRSGRSVAQPPGCFGRAIAPEYRSF